MNVVNHSWLWNLLRDRSFCYSGGMATTTEPSAPRVSKPRQHLLEVASELFYSYGITSVGVDRILTEASVTRATLYRHFHGKEGLVEAYLDHEDSIIRGYFDSSAEQATSPTHLLELIIMAIADDASRYHTRGCPFINAAAEYPDPESRVRKAVDRHRAWFFGLVEEAAVAANRPDPIATAHALVLVRDAALVGCYLEGPSTVRKVFIRTARLVAGLD